MPKPIKGAYRKRRKASRETLARKFRDAVWKRASTSHFGAVTAFLHYGRCGRCRTMLSRRLREGHVHHKRGRNVAPKDRFNPDAAELLCGPCHRKAHHQ